MAESTRTIRVEVVGLEDLRELVKELRKAAEYMQRAARVAEAATGQAPKQVRR